jgi:hypothetical protein
MPFRKPHHIGVLRPHRKVSAPLSFRPAVLPGAESAPDAVFLPSHQSIDLVKLDLNQANSGNKKLETP